MKSVIILYNEDDQNKFRYSIIALAEDERKDLCEWSEGPLVLEKVGLL